MGNERGSSDTTDALLSLSSFSALGCERKMQWMQPSVNGTVRKKKIWFIAKFYWNIISVAYTCKRHLTTMQLPCNYLACSTLLIFFFVVGFSVLCRFVFRPARLLSGLECVHNSPSQRMLKASKAVTLSARQPLARKKTESQFYVPKNFSLFYPLVTHILWLYNTSGNDLRTGS